MSKKKYQIVEVDRTNNQDRVIIELDDRDSALDVMICMRESYTDIYLREVRS